LRSLGASLSVYTRECLLGFIFDTTRGTPTHERERERPGGERAWRWAQEKAAHRTHRTGAGAWDSRRHEKRREAGYTPAHRTHRTGAGA
jgi:hypothetical protein